MKKTTPAAELKARILALKKRHAEDGALLKEQLLITYESLKPANLLKKTFHELVAAPSLKGDLLDTAISLGAGRLSQKAVTGSSDNPFRQFFGSLVQMTVTGIVSENTGGIRSGFDRMLNNLFNKKKTSL